MERFFTYDESQFEETQHDPEKILLSLDRFPNVTVDRLIVPEITYGDLQRRVRTVGASLNRKPLTMALCNAGISRSRLIASHLVADNLVDLSILNGGGSGVVKGLGYQDLLGFGFSESGVFDGFFDQPLDLILLNFAAHLPERFGDKQALTQIASTLERGMTTVNSLTTPLSIILLQGIEDDFRRWF